MIPNIIGSARASSKRTAPLLSLVRHKAAYEGEGKTTVRVLNQEQELGLMIDAYATYGFRLNNGITVLGPMALFPRTVLSWQVTGADQVTTESFSLFKLLQPKIDLIIIGLDSKERSAANAAFLAARAAGLNPEVLATEHACSTFNFLNAEGRDETNSVKNRQTGLNWVTRRSVAAALIPPTVIQMNENDMLQSKLHYQNLYKGDLSG